MNFKNSFVFILILTLVIVLLIPACANAKKRDLSTPLSKLVGYWQDSNGFEYYFGPVDPYTMTGYLLHVFPTIEKLIKFCKKILEYSTLEALKRGDFKSEEEAKKWAEQRLKQFFRGLSKEELEEISGRATYCQYKVLSQAPKGIKISISWPEDYAFMIYFPKEPIFYIEKNGKEMLIKDKWEKVINPLRYVDGKILPEGK